jgi:hypothetical protein
MISQQRPPDCLSDLRLDQLLSRELTGALEQITRAHVAACPLCERRCAELLADRERFADEAPTFEGLLDPSVSRGLPPRGGPARARASRRWLSTLAWPAAALLALGIGVQRLLRDAELGGATAPAAATRTKGSGAALGFVVRRRERSFTGEAGQVLHPGDVLRFTLSSATPLYAGVWGIDAVGRPSSYQASPELALLPAGQRQPFPEAVELDDSLGEERLLLVYCSTQVAVAEISRALAVSTAAPLLPGDCRSEALSIVKALP